VLSGSSAGRAAMDIAVSNGIPARSSRHLAETIFNAAAAPVLITFRSVDSAKDAYKFHAKSRKIQAGGRRIVGSLV
jgi:hypothetical protein